MASVVQICNFALSHLGAHTIASMTEQSTEAVQCNLFYEHTRDAVLRDFPWNFATKRQALADLGSPPTAWSYRYAMPSDCLFAREIERVMPATPRIDFVIESDGAGTGRVLLTNLSPATLIYTARITETTLFDPMFVEALSWRLAAQVAIPITRDRNIMQMCMTTYVNFLSQAQRSDGNEGQHETPNDAAWITARGIAADDTIYTRGV